jgi:xylan 1,4-beta-xylosidase
MKNAKSLKLFTASVVLCAAVGFYYSTVQAQQVVLAPGGQVPSPPLPRYVYNVVSADFAVGADHPLVKLKFNLYDPVGPGLEQFNQNMPKMGELNVDTYRLELGWGRRQGYGLHNTIGGTIDNLKYDFGPQDHVLRQLATQDVQLLGAYGYTPTPLQDPNLTDRYGEGNRKQKNDTPPKDLEKWREVVTAVVKHQVETGLRFGIHEVWNEPDGTYGFFSGTEEEFQQLYKVWVEAVRSVDPEAVVAGPGMDHHLLFNEKFPEFVMKNKLPLDVYSFHEYGAGELAVRNVDRTAASINRFPYFNTTTLSLDEWHDADCCNWCEDDVRHRYQGASQMLHDFNLLLAKPELSSVSWAWWQDPAGQGGGGGAARGAARGGDTPGGAGRAASPGCMGLVTRDGKRKAVYNAWKLYAMMPVDRRQVTIEGPLEAMASSDAHKAGVLIWNRDPYARRLDVNLKNLPFKKGNVRIYRIDREHASPVDGTDDVLTPAETYMNVDVATWSYTDGRIPEQGIMYFEAEDGTGQSELAPAKVAKVVRIDRYYPARSKTKSYADFDRKTWIARLGMADDRRADQQIGVLAEGLPGTLSFDVKVEGKLQKLDVNSALGVRVDYSMNGKYVRAVQFHGPYGGVDLYDKARTALTPWGLKQKPDDVVAVADLAKFQADLKKYAPAGWTGKAHITFVMQNAGAGTRAKFTVRPL